MNGFVYYLPGASQPVSRAYQLPVETRLEAVLEDRVLASGRINGPDGGPGIVFAIDGTPLQFGDGTHEWKPVKRDGKITHWIGWNKATPPGPSDLARPKQTNGHLVKLEDGNEWIIPCLHVPRRHLPERMVYDGDGGFSWEVAKKYREICERSEKFRAVFETAASSGDQQLNFSEVFEFWSDVISINYHVGAVECGCGNPLLSTETETVQGLWYAIFGYRAILDESEAQKKTETAPAIS